MNPDGGTARLTERQFLELWVGATTEVADRLHPKEVDAGRGVFLADTAVLCTEVLDALRREGVID